MKEEFDGYNEEDGLNISVTKRDIEAAKINFLLKKLSSECNINSEINSVDKKTAYFWASDSRQNSIKNFIRSNIYKNYTCSQRQVEEKSSVEEYLKEVILSFLLKNEKQRY